MNVNTYGEYLIAFEEKFDVPVFIIKQLVEAEVGREIDMDLELPQQLKDEAKTILSSKTWEEASDKMQKIMFVHDLYSRN